jgi:hypothetical protein
MATGEGNAIDVYLNEPKEDVWIQSLPADQFDKKQQSKSEQPQWQSLENGDIKIAGTRTKGALNRSWGVGLCIV